MGATLSSLVVFLFLDSSHLAQGTEFYVAPTGSDNNPGTEALPFATLERARDAVRHWKQAGQSPATEAVVTLRGGTYHRRQSFVLDAEDSGTAQSPILYQAYPGESVNLSGGIDLPLAEFASVTDPVILARVPVESHGKLRCINLKERGFHEYGQLSLSGASVLPPYTAGPNSPELFVNGQVMTLARWPNAEYARVDSVVESGANLRMWQADMVGRDDRRGTYVPPEKREYPPPGFAFTVASDRPKRWIGVDDAWLFGYWYWDWSDQTAQIESIDPTTHVIRTVHASGYGVRSKQRFYVFNLLEELDVPGEWFLDRKQGVLYYFPIEAEEQGTATVSLCTAPLLDLRQASYVTLRNLRLGTTCGDGIHITDGTGVVVENCDIGNLGGKAVIIEQGWQHTVRNCSVHDTGAGGIRASGGDRQTLLAAMHRIENNEITRFSRLRKTYTEAIGLDGVGNLAIGNLIHDAPHAAIHFLGNDHTMERNEIHHVLLESDDAGAVYSGRRLTFWGNKIRHNYFHDIYGLPPGQTRFKRILAHAIYLDDALSGIEVTGNIFYRCNDAICIKGSDNRLDGNVIIDCRKSIVDFSKTPGGTHAIPLRFDQPDRLPTNMDLTQLSDILSVPYTSQLWRERYPGLATSLETTYGAWRVSIVGNVLLRTPEIETTAWLKELGRIEGNTTLHDDVALDEATVFSAWLQGIPQRVPGFEPIPFTQIGLQRPVGPQ